MVHDGSHGLQRCTSQSKSCDILSHHDGQNENGGRVVVVRHGFAVVATGASLPGAVVANDSVVEGVVTTSGGAAVVANSASGVVSALGLTVVISSSMSGAYVVQKSALGVVLGLGGTVVIFPA
jgi:hypothetical protein